MAGKVLTTGLLLLVLGLACYAAWTGWQAIEGAEIGFHGVVALLRDAALKRVAARHGVSPAQAALAWTLRGPGVISIPKAADAAHLRENAAARDLRLTAEDAAELDAAFPPPKRKRPLEML